jgi:hypothetical protein
LVLVLKGRLDTNRFTSFDTCDDTTCSACIEGDRISFDINRSGFG